MYQMYLAYCQCKLPRLNQNACDAAAYQPNNSPVVFDLENRVMAEVSSSAADCQSASDSVTPADIATAEPAQFDAADSEFSE